MPVILDAGGADGPLSDHLLTLVTTFSPNETELARVTGMPTVSMEEVEAAARWCLQRVSALPVAVCHHHCSCLTFSHSRFLLRLQGPGEVVVKLGELGSLLVAADGEVVSQPCVDASSVVDTTGAGDTFTAAYAVGLAEKKSRKEALRFAGEHETQRAVVAMHGRVEEMTLMSSFLPPCCILQIGLRAFWVVLLPDFVVLKLHVYRIEL